MPTGERLYIPYAAPHDRLIVQPGARRTDGRAARIDTVLSPGPDRTSPACRHFGTCGGCALQHLSDRFVAAFKRGVVTRALERRGLAEVPIAETVSVPAGTRRRVEFAFRQGRPAVLGLHAVGEQRIVDLMECAVAVPTIVALLAPLRSTLQRIRFPKRSADIRITETDSGLDVLFLRCEEPATEARIALARLADSHDLARIGWSDGRAAEPIVQRRPPMLRLGTAAVALPLSYFLQPSRGGEHAIARIVAEAIAGTKRVADLYAGCGTLSFVAAAQGSVLACDVDDGMVAALRTAAVGLSLRAERRDLNRSPMTAEELKPFEAVIFDPPHAGARAQAEYMAASSVATVVAVSCNPSTLARDLRILVDGGYRIEMVTPVDQFTWSAEVEAVAVLRRG